MKPITTLEENILLSIYNLKDNAYLVSIMEYLHENAGLKLAIGSVFAPLDRLYKKEYLTVENGSPSPKVGGRAIRYYHLTDAGIEALRARQEVINSMWTGFNTMRSES